MGVPAPWFLCGKKKPPPKWLLHLADFRLLRIEGYCSDVGPSRKSTVHRVCAVGFSRNAFEPVGALGGTDG